jgi:hypothetical protein
VLEIGRPGVSVMLQIIWRSGYVERFLTRAPGFNPDGFLSVGPTDGKDLQLRLYAKKPRTIDDLEENLWLEHASCGRYDENLPHPVVHRRWGRSLSAPYVAVLPVLKTLNAFFTTGVVNIRLSEFFFD